MFLFSKEKGIYRVIIGIGDEISEGYLQKLTRVKEGAVKLANFEALSGKANDIHNLTCSKY